MVGGEYMISGPRAQFLAAVFRMKKGAACFPPSVGMQSSELAVMYKASVGCTRSPKGYTVSEIQQSLHISKPAVSQILNNLESKGYIIRSIASGDRRKIVVTLTREGEAELRCAMRCQDEALEKVFEQFGDENIRLFIDLTNRLMDILEELNMQQNERCE